MIVTNTSSIVNSIFTKVAKGSAYGLILKVVTTGINFLIAIMLARLLEPAGYGEYVLAITVISFLAIPTTLGLPNLVVRYVAIYKEKMEWGLLRGLMYFANYAVLLLSLVVAFVGYLIADYYKYFFNTSNNEIFIIALIMLPILSLISIHGAILRGLHYIVTGQLSGTIIKSSLFVVFVAIYYFYEPTRDPTIVMLGNVICTIIAFFVGVYLVIRNRPIEISYTALHMDSRKWLKSALPLLLMGGLFTMNQQMDLLMIGYFMPTSSVGVYQVALRLSEIVTFILIAGNSAIGPTISVLFSQNKIYELQLTVTRFARMVTFFTLPLAIIIFIFGGLLIETLFGANYVDAYEPLVILMVGQCVNVLVGPVGILLIMTGFVKLAAQGLFISLLVNVLLNVILIPDYGMKGAAIATATSLIIWNILLYKFSIKTTGIYCSVIQPVLIK